MTTLSRRIYLYYALYDRAVRLTANPTINLYFGRGFFVLLAALRGLAEADRLNLEKRSVRLCRVIATMLEVIN